VRERLARLIYYLMDPEHSRRAALLAKNPIFEGLPHRTIGRLLPRMFEKVYEPSDVVFRAGDPGHGLFVVLEGEVEILRARADPLDAEERLALLGANSAFGELALIDDHPRAATARVLKSTRILILYRSEFESLMSGEPRVALAVARNLLRIVATYARQAALQRHAAPPASPRSHA
jgi:CRP/FNR family cyclic AMP-dependent transcriptional regulator